MPRQQHTRWSGKIADTGRHNTETLDRDVAAADMCVCAHPHTLSALGCPRKFACITTAGFFRSHRTDLMSGGMVQREQQCYPSLWSASSSHACVRTYSEALRQPAKPLPCGSEVRVEVHSLLILTCGLRRRGKKLTQEVRENCQCFPQACVLGSRQAGKASRSAGGRACRHREGNSPTH